MNCWSIAEWAGEARKSHVGKESARECKKSARLLELRSGAGPMPTSFKISQTVELTTFTPSTSSSPCRRLYPQPGGSRARRDTRRG